jgi:membrane associated rhomboid family serine protease
MRYRSGYGFNSNNVIWGLIAANLLFFVLTLIMPELVYVFGISRVTVITSPWTLATSMFTHGSFSHIFGNMFTLYFFGTFLRQIIGQKRFLFTYFTGGLAGNLLHILMASPFALAVGASGAVFAVGGALAVLRPKTRVFVFPIPVPMPLWVVVIGGFILLSFLPGVAWQAHLGGLLVGLGSGYYFRRHTSRYY